MSKYVYYSGNVWVITDTFVSDNKDKEIYEIKSVNVDYGNDVSELFEEYNKEDEETKDIEKEYVDIESDYIKEGLVCPNCSNVCDKNVGLEEKFDEYKCKNKNCRVIEVDTPSWDLSE